MPFRPMRALAGVVVLAGAAYVAAKPVGPAPALGPFLEPAHGVWSLARTPDLPDDEVLAIPGLDGRVTVQYDRRGVPHIFATTEPDAYRALGYVVARDRLVQLYMQTMAASGRLTEIAGPRALELDREMRQLGFPWAAERKAKYVNQDSSGADALVHAYADGVNAWIDHMPREALPLEFRLIGKTPEHWEPINTAHLLNRMGWTLAYLTPELTRLRAAAKVGDAAAAGLFPVAQPIQEPIQPNGQHAPRFDVTKVPAPGTPDSSAARLVAMLDQLLPDEPHTRANPEPEERSFASNNWAVSPRRTAAGHALLAGDPHLDLTLPSIWYEAHLVVPGKLDVYGVTIPGAPGIIIGFNRDVAWTFTNTGADVLDYYAEHVDDVNHPTRYMVDGQWKPLERRVEVYRGKNGAPVATDTMYFTHRGPMHRDSTGWVSMRWTVLEPSDEVAAFTQAAHARSTREFEDAMAAHFFAPAQNMLVADRSGSIAIRSTGRYPIRPDSAGGMIIRDGSKSASDWKGWLPLERYPQAFDPAQGYLASANQQPIDPKQTTDYWGGSYDPWRALHINALLRADSQMTPDKMRQFQLDPGSARADLFMPYFLRGAEADAKRHEGTAYADTLRRAAKLLGEWDRRYTKENTRAVLFEKAMTELGWRTWDELRVTPSGDKTVAWPSAAMLANLLHDSTNVWWDDRTTHNTVEDRDAIIGASMAAALRGVVKKYGEPSDKWAWRNVQHANIEHLMMIPALSALDLAVPGGPETLWPSSGMGHEGPSWRMVVELGPTVRAWGTYPGGQSGNPASVRYKDRLPLWLSGQLDTLAMPHDTAELRGHTRGRVTLVPAGGK